MEKDSKISGLNKIIPFEELNLSVEEAIELEELSKACPRCGGKSANASNPQGRCSSCLKKLSTAKKKPGSAQRAQTKFDDAKRRENGKNGTAHKKHKGKVKSRKQFVSKFQSDEKKTGSKLSPDRKDNSAGYASSNVRNVPEKLNRGRHTVDPKKLRAWKKKLKKHDITVEEFYTLMKAKFAADEAVSDLLKSLSPEGLEDYIALFDQE